MARTLNGAGVHVDVVPHLFEILDPQVRIHAAEGLTLMALPPARWPRSSLLLKRALDLSFAAVGLVLLAPLFAVVAATIKLDSRGPVFFRQVRIGAGGRPFRMLKFRTMVADADARKQEFAHLNRHADGDPRMFKIPGDPRATRVGRTLRAYSIDELPQLVNVLRGEMSLVGPRPLVPDEDRHVDGWRRKRLELKPGITGLWQVLGRDGIPFEEMVELDYRYVTYWSVTNDLKLIMRTLPLLRRRHAA
jgi:lipopolysaccharide/colanic/teichoic acid biosynthesis glycosyltransferase